MLIATHLDLGVRRVSLGLVARPLIAALGTIATGVKWRCARLREPDPEGLVANSHVTAEVCR